MTMLEKFPGEKGRAERMAGVQKAVSGCPEILVPLMAKAATGRQQRTRAN